MLILIVVNEEGLKRKIGSQRKIGNFSGLYSIAANIKINKMRLTFNEMTEKIKKR